MTVLPNGVKAQFSIALREVGGFHLRSGQFSHLVEVEKCSSADDVRLVVRQHCEQFPGVYEANEYNRYSIFASGQLVWSGLLKDLISDSAVATIET
jgi:hypothetical protein